MTFDKISLYLSFWMQYSRCRRTFSPNATTAKPPLHLAHAAAVSVHLYYWDQEHLSRGWFLIKPIQLPDLFNCGAGSFCQFP